MPTLLDREEDGYPASNAFGISHVPSLFLVEPDGAISLASSGFVEARSGGHRRGAPGSSRSMPEEKVPEWKAG